MCCTCVVSSIISIYFLGLTCGEKKMVLKSMNVFLLKFEMISLLSIFISEVEIVVFSYLKRLSQKIFAFLGDAVFTISTIFAERNHSKFVYLYKHYT